MKKINSLRIALVVLGLSSVASLVGSISGTIAWYAYSTRALVSYSGTSVQSATQLQIGLKSSVEVDYSAYPFMYEDTSINDANYHYYFMRVGAGGMPAQVINEYLSTNGYTTNILEPVSSYTYTTGGALNLRNRPVTNKPPKENEDYTTAETTKYVKIPFVFRVLTVGSTSEYVPNHEIFLSGATAVTDDENKIINRASRLYIDREDEEGHEGEKDFILNPTSESNGQTKVAGVLNLSGGGEDLVTHEDSRFFDYDNDPSSPTYLQEFLYGEYDWKEGKTWANSLSDPLDESSGLVDINGSGNTTNSTTFTSRHYKGIKYFSDLSCINPHYAQYFGYSTVYPTKNALTGELEGDYAVCKTGTASNNYIGSFNMTIYIEGWDFAVVDSEAGYPFNLGLTFSTNDTR